MAPPRNRSSQAPAMPDRSRPRPGPPRPRERWIAAGPALLAAHGALIGALQARPGLPGVYLWYIGPPALALLACAALGAALFATVRTRATWDGTRLVGLAALVAAVGLVPFYRTYPSSHDHRPSHVRFRLPLDGPVTVVWGGDRPETNYHVSLPDQRWAYDLLVTDNGRSHRGSGTRVEEYLVYDRPVRAPAAGVVRAVRDGEPDEPPRARRWGLWRRALGNYVVIEVAPGEFLFVAHLRPGSVQVVPGQPVVAGQVIARVGNSGRSTEPHVHLHLQDTPRPFFGEGIPLMFSDYRVGDRLVTRGIPQGGFAGGRFTGEVVRHVGDGDHERPR